MVRPDATCPLFRLAFVGRLDFASSDQAKLFVGQLASYRRDVFDDCARYSLNFILFLHDFFPFIGGRGSRV